MIARYPAADILQAFAPKPLLPASAADTNAPGTFTFCQSGGVVVTVGRHTDLIKQTARFAVQMHFDGLSRQAAIAALEAERARGRWTREIPDHELHAALDSALEKCRRGEWKEAPSGVGMEPSRTSLAEALAREITPFTDDDFLRASASHPHIFQHAGAGAFPVGEVTIVAAPGREGKTYAMVHVGAACVLGLPLAGLAPPECLRVLCYSNEDDRIQYARKVRAICSRLPPADVERLRRGLLVPDLEVPGLVEAREIVGVSDRRRPVPTAMVDALIAVLKPLATGPDRIGMVIFETASTLSDADEDNPGLKTLVAALKRIARELSVAAVLVHHTSQAAAANLPSLNVSVADIRGGTTLAFNTRQCFLLVNLGSADDPFPERDMRTLLRRFVAPFYAGRVTALICLDSSKSMDPPPVFLAWVQTEYGPTMQEIHPPAEIAGARWRKVRSVVIAHAQEERKENRAEQHSADASACVAMAIQLHDEGKHPTVRAVSRALGHGADWARSRLEGAAARGQLVRSEECIPKTKGKTDVYRPAALPPPELSDHYPSEPTHEPTG
ncbi:hypothetical protein J2X06_001709 [Lysobacter niastensis]|uniref:AAA family ATPase n=1 Tax=Lysobacter niastensis TaxID=380629 RepID=A0ABU1WA99_9GAMM|nr:AAA family ATPase [Lysobacter niastensis]MDR7134525.1 hypothetical protein [Lysobacter niastensis]